jgi:hypothetical protein
VTVPAVETVAVSDRDWPATKVVADADKTVVVVAKLTLTGTALEDTDVK